MDIFTLPVATKVQRVIPKNAFESYTNARQQRLFTDLIRRITWTHKLSPETVNLPGKELKEIQIFNIQLKVKEDIPGVMDIIDKAIPYAIIFIVEHQGSIYLSTSAKHPHPVNENNSVIDWTFRTDWFSPVDNQYPLNLKRSLDFVYLNFCAQLAEYSNKELKSINDLFEFSRKVDALEKEIQKLKSGISSCKQFNQKVALNMRLKEVEKKLSLFLNNKTVL